MTKRLKTHKTVGRSLSLLLQVICATSTACAFCYKTPADAIAASLKTSSYSILEDGGYRVAMIQSDPLLRKSWARVVPCAHPEWPAVAFPLHDSIMPAQRKAQAGVTKVPAHVVVRAGDIVRLWRQEDVLRIEVAGIAEGNGGLGDLVKVRLFRKTTDDQTIAAQFFGIVRGTSDVEIKP